MTYIFTDKFEIIYDKPVSVCQCIIVSVGAALENLFIAASGNELHLNGCAEEWDIAIYMVLYAYLKN